MATSPELHEPQIAAARAAAWHQNGDPLLTLDAARPWLQQFGLVLFAPRAGSLGAPAPSLVEATLGAPRQTATLAETETARSLAARLVGEGSAVPLNLLGGPGDLPDFLVSAQAFPFVFTLRGDKGWKRPPETAGAVKVTPLGLRVYELLQERGDLTLAEIVPEIGREVTESAVARALSELWQILRVVPVLQQGEGETRWELITARFLKSVKAGANAGQPTALSALASLYLTQVFVASEEEISAFLSPVTARSRVRDVLHGLTAGRQLAEGVIQGKAVLYMPDELPDFSAFAEPEAEAEGASADSDSDAQGTAAEGGEEGRQSRGEPRERIRRFGGEGGGAKDRMLRGKPVRRERAPGERAGRPEPRALRERSDASAGAEGGRPERQRNAFSRPWEEENAASGEARESRPPRDRAAGQGDRPLRRRDSGDDRGGRERFARPGGRSAPGRGEGRPPRREGDRPFRRKEGGEGEGAGRPREGAREKRPFGARTGAGDRPFRPRTEEAGERPARPRTGGGDRPPRREFGGGDRPFRPRREEGDRPFRPRSGEGERPARPRAGDGERRPFRPRTEGEGRPARPRNEGGDRPFRPRREEGDRPFRPRAEGSARPFRPREGSGREEGRGDRRGPGGPPRTGFRREGAPGGRPAGARGPRPGGDRPFRPASKGASSRPFGRPDRPGKPGRPDRSPRGDRPGGGDRSSRPARPPRRPRPEDEA